MEFGIEKCAMLVMKNGKRQLTDGMEQLNKDKIKTLAENEKARRKRNLLTWASWRLTPSNKRKWKKKFRKDISREPENYSRQNSIAEILSKE